MDDVYFKTENLLIGIIFLKDKENLICITKLSDKLIKDMYNENHMTEY